ncbi:hypothetical protein ACFL3T_02695 [Patescibacteria group bacterium]
MFKKLFFSENRLVYMGPEGGPGQKDVAAAVKESKEARELPYNKEKLDKFVKDELNVVDSTKVEDFAKEIKGKPSSEANRDFFVKVLGFKSDYMAKQSDQRIAVVVKGFQEQLNKEFSKAKLKVDGKLGGQTLSQMATLASVENGDEMTDEGDLIGIAGVSMSDLFTSIDAATLVKCKGIKGTEQQNLFMWNKVLGLEEPSTLGKKGMNKYIQKQLKYLQKYLVMKAGAKITEDGKFGPKSIAAFQKYLATIKVKQEESVTDKRPTKVGRDIAGVGDDGFLD